MPETERNVTALSPNDTKKDMAKGQVKADIRLKTGIWHAKLWNLLRLRRNASCAQEATMVYAGERHNDGLGGRLSGFIARHCESSGTLRMPSPCSLQYTLPYRKELS